MKMRQLWVSIVLFTMLCLTMGVTQAQEKSYSAERFDVALAVEEGGSVLVTETVVFNFVGGPFTLVFRELPLDHTDGISIVETSVDGVTYPVGANAGQVEISTGNPMRITWHLEPTSNTTHTVVLTYRADGVVRQEDGTDALYWQPLPDEYDYFIGESETLVTYPANAILISAPAVLAGTAVTNQSPNKVTFTTQNLQANSPLVFMMQFEEGSLITAPPNWQAEQRATAGRRAVFNSQIPLFITFALFIFGFGFAIMFVYQRRYTAPSSKTKLTVMEPPGKLPAGLAGAVVSGGTPDWNHAQGTMFGLAEQGVLNIEELPDKKWYRKHDFTVKQIDQAAGLKPHEVGFLDMLFGEKDGRVTSIKLSEMGKKITGSAWKKYKEPLQEEIEHAGYLNKARKKAKVTLFVVGGLLLMLGVFGFIGTAILAGSYGLGPMAVAGAVTALGIAGIIFGESLTPLSDAGAETAVSWQAFKNYLTAVSKGKQAVDSPTLFEKYLPYAATFGLLQQWAKHFEKEGWTETPAYFHTLSGVAGNQAMVAFVAMSAATHSSGGSATGAGAGAAGAGSAGGGASGAG